MWPFITDMIHNILLIEVQPMIRSALMAAHIVQFKFEEIDFGDIVRQRW